MTAQETAYYQAYKARDARFDGVFFIGVTSTGIYCRPVCTARTPREENCRFFPVAAGAEAAGFRPCLRCRPELAPGYAPVDDARRIAHQLLARIDDGIADGEAGIETIAAQFQLTSRQIRRIVKKELGVSPLQLVQTHRLLLAKQLLTETALPVTEIAFASGFSSLRRFNDAFLTRYGMPPGRLRKAAANGTAPEAPEASTLMIAYRPPYDWQGMLAFLSTRALKGVEQVTESFYARTVRLGPHRGWIKVRHAPDKNTLLLDFSHSLAPVLPALLTRVRNLFDVAAQPGVINDSLRRDAVLRPRVAARPGLRVPGAFDGFELALRAVLGQQVTVKAATTLAGRCVDEFGDKLSTPFAALSRLSPAAGRMARADAADIAALGIVGARAKSIVALAKAVTAQELVLEPGADPQKLMASLTALPGIGPWTAHYIAMRALRWPDAFPKEDIAIRKALGGVTPKVAEELSQAWRPWRSYAVLHLWGG